MLNPYEVSNLNKGLTMKNIEKFGEKKKYCRYIALCLKSNIKLY